MDEIPVKVNLPKFINRILYEIKGSFDEIRNGESL